jgi:hypothetical protein
MYAGTWEIYYSFRGEEFMEFYRKSYIENMREDGATTAELSAMKADLEKWGEYYRNPFVRFAMTITEILPVGIAISLIAAGILRKRQFLPA